MRHIMILLKKISIIFIPFLYIHQTVCMEKEISPAQQIEFYINQIESEVDPNPLQEDLERAISALENKKDRTIDEQELLAIATYYQPQLKSVNKQLTLTNTPQKMLPLSESSSFFQLQFLITQLNKGHGIPQKDIVRARKKLALHFHAKRLPKNVNDLIQEADYYINAFDGYRVAAKEFSDSTCS